LIVVDASAFVEMLLRTPAGKRVSTRVLRPGETMHAPHLTDVEVLHVLRRYGASGSLTSVRADEAVADFLKLRIHRHRHRHLAPRIWELRHNMSAYDAAYIALAETLAAPLLTADARLARAPHHRVTIEAA